jgi:hypothetical protein
MLKPFAALVLLGTAAAAVCAVTSGGAAEPGVPADPLEPTAKRELRRALLRDAVRPHPATPGEVPPSAGANPVPRRLTVEQRAQLREQLRRLQSEGARRDAAPSAL